MSQKYSRLSSNLFTVVIVLLLQSIYFASRGQPLYAPSIPSSNKLFDIIRTGNAKALEQALANGASANDSLSSYTALMAATLNGTVDQMKVLIEHGANVNYQSSNGTTALWLAVPDWDKTNLLLDHGADINHKVQNYGILVKVAAMPGALQIFKLLVDRGADPKKATDDNFLLYNAASSGDTAIIGWLLRYGFKANDTVSFGDYPLTAALNYRQSDAVKMLIDNGANVNAQPRFGLPNLQGQTFLMSAAVSNDKPSFYYLLDHGADPNMKCKKGYTALMMLQQSEYDEPDMTLALIKHGADVSYKAIDGTDAVYFAKQKGSTKSLAILQQHAKN